MYARFPREDLLPYLARATCLEDLGPLPGELEGAGPPGLGPGQFIEKVCTAEPRLPGILHVKYFYEPTQSWCEVDIHGHKTIAELRYAIFRQEFVAQAEVELKYMDALQLFYTKPCVHTDEPLPDEWGTYTRDTVNLDRLPYEGRLETLDP